MARRVRLTPAEFAEKHARNTVNALGDMQRGVERVTEAPGLSAAANQAKMKSKLMASIDSGKWARRVASVSVEEWRDAMLNKGLGRVASGVEAARGKQEAFATELFAYEERLMADIDKMPDLTLEDSINRQATWTRGMAKFERS